MWSSFHFHKIYNFASSEIIANYFFSYSPRLKISIYSLRFGSIHLREHNFSFVFFLILFRKINLVSFHYFSLFKDEAKAEKKRGIHSALLETEEIFYFIFFFTLVLFFLLRLPPLSCSLYILSEFRSILRRFRSVVWRNSKRGKRAWKKKCITFFICQMLFRFFFLLYNPRTRCVLMCCLLLLIWTVSLRRRAHCQ